ncbi:MAG: ABC transporter substrate-binding protein [Gammaproteobacteria bacterium]|nr:ABC transporter substrate-binding protein [Gammaproteobacteria bacterium]
MKKGGILLLAILYLFLAGCQDVSQRPLKVATNQWPGYEPLYLARYLDAFHSDIEVVQLASTTDVMRALRNGSVEVAAMTLDEALLLGSQGEPLSVLMAMDFSNGADVVMAWPEIKSLADIRGKRVGVESTALGAIMLAAALDQAGLTLADVELVDLPSDQHAEALLQHKVDVIVTFEPVRTLLRKAGAVVLFDSSAVPELIVDVLVARREVLESRDEQLQDLVRGYYEARSYMITHPAEAHAFIARRQQLTSLELQHAFAGLRLPSLNDNIRWLAGNPSPFQTQVQQLHRQMRERNLLQGDTEPDLMAAPRWLEGVRP